MKTVFFLAFVGSASILTAVGLSLARVKYVHARSVRDVVPDPIALQAARPLIVSSRFDITGKWLRPHSMGGTCITITGDIDKRLGLTMMTSTCLAHESVFANGYYTGGSLIPETALKAKSESIRAIHTVTLDGEELLVPDAAFVEFRRFAYANTELSNRVARQLAFARID